MISRALFARRAAQASMHAAKQEKRVRLRLKRAGIKAYTANSDAQSAMQAPDWPARIFQSL